VAKGIREGRPGASTPFRYFDKGALAVVGRGKAVCEIRGLELSGRLAFFTYLGVHLYYLGGQVGRRVQVLIKWVGARFGERQSALIEGDLSTVERAQPPAQAVR
jgi:NADH:ubiquinone reductase (H+-translocating)